MIVYIVEVGTQNEGGSVERVYHDRDAAIAFCRSYAMSDSEAMTEALDADDASRWRITTVPDDGCELVLYWGCYYALVKSWEVR